MAWGELHARAEQQHAYKIDINYDSDVHSLKYDQRIPHFSVQRVVIVTEEPSRVVTKSVPIHRSLNRYWNAAGGPQREEALFGHRAWFARRPALDTRRGQERFELGIKSICEKIIFI